MSVDVEQAYRLYGHSVLRRARRLLGDAHEAQEVLQEVFLDLLRNPDQFRGQSAPSTFLYSATTHRCLNRLRDDRTRHRLLRDRAEKPADSVAVSSSDDYVEARQILAHLPEQEAAAAAYYYIDEMSHQEIAEIMGCSRRHVGDLLERSRQATVSREGRENDAQIPRP